MLRSFFIPLLSVLFFSASLCAQEVLLTRDQALHEIFPDGAKSVDERKPLDAALRARLQRDLGRRIAEDTIEVTKVYDASGTFRGYAVITEEIGKYRPITFMVGATPQLAVKD